MDMIQTAVQSFIDIIPYSVVAITSKHDHDLDIQIMFWEQLAQTFGDFLSELPSRLVNTLEIFPFPQPGPDRSHNHSIEIQENGKILGMDHLIEFESMQVEVTNLLIRHVLPYAQSADKRIQVVISISRRSATKIEFHFTD